MLLAQPAVPGEQAERILRLHGRGFSFEVVEPPGWLLDTRSAPQVANFIFYPEGGEWRGSDRVIFARFVPRRPEESTGEFLRTDRENFGKQCPLGNDGQAVSPGEAVSGFSLQRFDCPPSKPELVAVRSVPGFFVVFVLVAPEDDVPARKAFDAILRSFKWREGEVGE